MTLDTAAPERAASPYVNGANGAGSPVVVGTDALGRRRPPPDGYTVAVIERVRGLVVETPKSLVEIASETDISRTTISNWLQRYRWKRPDGAPPLAGSGSDLDPASRQRRLAVRLYRVLGRQLTGLERRARDDENERAEKDARTLSVLAKTLETLHQLDRDDGAKVKAPEPADRDDLDADLADRIAAWAARGEQT